VARHRFVTPRLAGAGFALARRRKVPDVVAEPGRCSGRQKRASARHLAAMLIRRGDTIPVSRFAGDQPMKFGLFFFLALLLFFIWVGSFVVFHVAGALIHLLLVVAVIMLLINLFKGRKSA
jgi:Family of unknown function (DUF5670)